MTAVGPTALKATEAEKLLVGKAPGDAAFHDAARLAESASMPTSDLRGPAEYKKSMIGVLARRAFHRAAERARGGT